MYANIHLYIFTKGLVFNPVLNEFTIKYKLVTLEYDSP